VVKKGARIDFETGRETVHQKNEQWIKVRIWKKKENG
jgi:hypothetical protein